MRDDSLERIPLDWPHRDLSRSIRLGELEWHVQVGGSGPVLLLLHGTGASAHSFSDLMRPLFAHFTVVVPDLPGHGFTLGARMQSLTLPAIARALDDLLTVLGSSDVALVAGHSAGAPLAMRWALSRDRQPDALVGFNPALVAPPATYMELVAPLVVPLATSPLVAGFVAQFGSATGMVDRLLRSTGSEVSPAQRARYATLFRRPSHVRGAMGLMAAADLPQLLRDVERLAAPITFILGGQDQWIPSAKVRSVIARHFPRALVATWPGGHLLHEADPIRAAQLLEATSASVRPTGQAASFQGNA